ncbi:thiamine phosphate synthase [Novosphingobium sp. FKTRR1]|uniref:thiamine phosphate synthase n=1 Tax=Novosphingobium sp. FKTRR1 TaxID=2879118 RepID=UPI001CEFC36E|nr:thiamine phosphate synthase [Novosphingobium sp. FKTRR1]
MAKRHPVRTSTVPSLVLLSDARIDAVLDRAIKRLPRGSALVFRHYHLPPLARAARRKQLARACRARGIALVDAGAGYGPASVLRGPAACRQPLRLATAHDLRELGAATRCRADAVLLSPVFPTRSHPGARGLGAVRFLLLARQSALPVIALGGMTAARFRRLTATASPVHGWAAIDGLS